MYRSTVLIVRGTTSLWGRKSEAFAPFRLHGPRRMQGTLSPVPKRFFNKAVAAFP
jgi:hypothetical protein